MNIDERLEKLVARHEALAQSVELLSAENHSLAQLVREVTENMKELESFAGVMSRMLLSHEDRLNRLEDGNAA